MATFSHGSIKSIPTTSPRLEAFQIDGHVTDDDMEAIAEHMNRVFDVTDDKVDMLVDMSGMTGRDLDAMLDGDVIKAQLRSWSGVRRYVVIAAPERAAKMIEWADKVIPVEARAFDASETDAAWSFVGAHPVGTVSAVPGQPV